MDEKRRWNPVQRDKDAPGSTEKEIAQWTMLDFEKECGRNWRAGEVGCSDLLRIPPPGVLSAFGNADCPPAC